MLVFHAWGSRELDGPVLHLMIQVSQRHDFREHGVTANEYCVVASNGEVVILRCKVLPGFEDHPAWLEDQLEFSKGGARRSSRQMSCSCVDVHDERLSKTR